MKNRTLIFIFLTIAAFALAASAQSSTTGYGTLLADLVTAYESPSEGDLMKIDADVEAIGEDLAQFIAEHWKMVYLDPDYKLYCLGKDDASFLPVHGAHAIVVLGYELKDGEMTDELKGRCEAAAEVARAFPESIVVCSGGATGANNPEKHTEAGMMKAYLSENCSIDGNRIFTDERAMTTAENAINTFAILKKQKIETMTIVTSSYHQRWGQVLYHTLSVLYRQEEGYSAEIIGNYCFEIEPENPVYLQDARIAARQLAGILGLSKEETALIPQTTRRGR